MRVISKTTLFLVLTFSAAFLSGSIAIAGSRMDLPPALIKELNFTLEATDNLHRALAQQDEDQVEITSRVLIYQIDRVRIVSAVAKSHERGHLLRILEVARDHLEVTQTSFADDRRLQLQEAFNQLVNIVRIYKLDGAYGIFFCPKDKSAWVQKGKRGMNPFRPETLRNCAMRVPN